MRRYSLRVRLLVLTIVLTVLPVLVLTIVATRNTRASVEQEIVTANSTRIDWASQYTEGIVRGLDGLFTSLQIDPEFDQLLSRLKSRDSTVADFARRELGQLLSAAYFANSSLIDELALWVAATGEAIAVDNVSSGRVSVPEPESGPWRAMAGEPVPLRLMEVDGQVYALHTINRFEDRALRGAFAARLDEAFEHDVLDILAAGESDRVVIQNDLGEEVVRSGGAIPPALRTRLDELPALSGDPYVWSDAETIGFARRIDRGRMTVAKTVPMEMVMRSTRDTMTIGLVSGLVLAALSVLLSIVFSLRISRPISELAESMRGASIPDFNRLTVQSHDDVRLLEEGYRALLVRMKELAQKEYEQEIELKDARLLALQAQINPHFLNNTLNLLGGMALAKGATEVYRLARAVGDMFRYAVGSEGDLVTLEQELAHVRNYLLIQENRFAGRCEVLVDVEPRVLATAIPRFTLQPLVENAFEHGLQGKPGTWKVTVRCAARRRGTMVVVQDDGVGVPPERLRRLRASLRSQRSDSGHTSIGLRNVDTRLRLHFGERTRVRLRSVSGCGTVVLFVLPGPAATSRKEVP